MLTHTAAALLLRKLDLPTFNCVMDAGGRFVLLAPNTPQSQQAVTEFRSFADEWFVTHHAGLLTLNIDDSLACSGNDFIGDGFRHLYNRLQTAADNAKRRKLSAWLQPSGRWQVERQVLGVVHDRQRRADQFQHDGELGRRLPRTRYVGLWDENPPNGLLRGDNGANPNEILGCKLQLFSREEVPPQDILARASTFLAVTNPPEEAMWCPYSILPNYIPRLTNEDLTKVSGKSTDEDAEDRKVGGVMTFQDLAEISSYRHDTQDPTQNSGQPAIACLKADVDRLGYLFSRGLRGHVSFGRVSTFSRTLDYFFRAFLTGRFEEPPSDRPEYRYVYTVFAGGDDLMLVGPWQVMLHLAVDLHQWFTHLTGGNPDVTISAGLAMGHGRTPISGLVETAEQQLELAKQDRDRIAVFGDVFTWNQYKEALKDAGRLDDLLFRGRQPEQLPLNTGFVYRLLQYEQMRRKVIEAMNDGSAIRLQDLRGELTWRSHLSYDLERNIRQRIKKSASDEVRSNLEWLEQLVGLPAGTEPTSALKLCATYALYRNRGGSRS